MKNREKLNMEISNFHIYDVETINREEFRLLKYDNYNITLT